MARVLVVGCGYVGSALALDLHKHGHTVWGLRRDVLQVPEGVTPIAADVGDPDTLETLPGKLDHVVYTVSSDASSDEAYQLAYVTGLRNVIEALTAQGQTIERFIFTSSTGVYGQSDGDWVDEVSPAESTSFMGARVRAGEQLVLSAPWKGIVLRLGGIYGPGRSHLLNRVRDGKATLHDGPPAYANLIHRDDCAEALRFLLNMEQPEDIYLGVDHEPAERNDLYRWIADHLDQPEPPVGKPGESAAHRPRGNKRCCSYRLRVSGYTFLYPTFREGIAAILEEEARHA
jgi:nucleoside-diphosphate-sugar epimerase